MNDQREEETCEFPEVGQTAIINVEGELILFEFTEEGCWVEV